MQKMRSIFLGIVIWLPALLSGAALSARAETGLEEATILDRINELRMQGATCPNGRSFAPAGRLMMSSKVSEAAQAWSRRQLQAGSLSHGDFADRIRNACPNPGTTAENVAGNSSAQGTVTSWMESEEHCENIMNPAFTRIGIGHAAGGRFGGFWTADFVSNPGCS